MTEQKDTSQFQNFCPKGTYSYQSFLTQSKSQGHKVQQGIIFSHDEALYACMLSHFSHVQLFVTP